MIDAVSIFMLFGGIVLGCYGIYYGLFCVRADADVGKWLIVPAILIAGFFVAVVGGVISIRHLTSPHPTSEQARSKVR